MADPKPMPPADTDHGQKPPSDDYAVRQRHRIGEPATQEDGFAETPPK